MRNDAFASYQLGIVEDLIEFRVVVLQGYPRHALLWWMVNNRLKIESHHALLLKNLVIG